MNFIRVMVFALAAGACAFSQTAPPPAVAKEAAAKKAEPKQLTEKQQLAAAQKAIKFLQAQSQRLAVELENAEAVNPARTAREREASVAAEYRALTAKLAEEAGAPGCDLDGEQKLVCKDKPEK